MKTVFHERLTGDELESLLAGRNSRGREPRAEVLPQPRDCTRDATSPPPAPTADPAASTCAPSRSLLVAGCLAALLLGVACLWKANLGAWLGPAQALASEALSPSIASGAPGPQRLLTRAIKDLRPGMRVLAENPELQGEQIPPLVIERPAEWRLATVELPKADGGVLTVELLRTREELAVASGLAAPAQPEDGAAADPGSLPDLVSAVFPPVELPLTLIEFGLNSPTLLAAAVEIHRDLKKSGGAMSSVVEPSLRDAEFIGRTLYIDMPEMGAIGDATIIAMADCPPIEQGEGRLVTARFLHRAANVIDLYVDSEREPIGTTTTHPFWSESRRQFVPAGELRVGEELCALNGSRSFVVSMVPRGPPVDVFNIEVEGVHAYFASADGILVHNGCTPHQYANKVVGRAGGDTGKAANTFVGASGRTRISDGIRGSVRYEAKRVKGKWGNSAYNPKNYGKFSRATHAYDHLVSQLDDYGKLATKVVYYSNSKALLQEVRRLAKANGYTNIVTRYVP